MSNNRFVIFLCLVIFTILFSCSNTDENTIKYSADNIIPKPLSVESAEGSYFLTKNPSIYIADKSLTNEAGILNSWLGGILSESKNADISLLINKKLAVEEYLIAIGKNGVKIEGSNARGIFYGIQSLRQILPISIEKGEFKGANLSFVNIDDSPEFTWRGLHLDVSRHFMSVDFVKKYIDYIAMHKMNVFHWHLVDGVGWRIEIEKYPKLTEWGAWRIVKGPQPWIDFEVAKPGDSRKKDGGFYTKNQIKEIVAYAAKKHITVLPEIELPGHSEVVFQCYPELMCQDGLENIGVYCAGNNKSYTFLENILDEVIELFPSEYIHIGGDEVNKANWEKCEKCRLKMNEEDLKDTYELQSNFINHFDNYLMSKGRKLIGWHEILEGELSKSASIMFWGAEHEVSEVLSEGHKTVLSTGSHLYLDHYQSLSKNEPRAFGGFSNLSKVYNYQVIPNGINKNQKDLILGVQANIWTEYMPNPEDVEYMLFPRIAALSEISWTPQGNKDFSSFKKRLPFLLDRYNIMDVNVAKSAYIPEINISIDSLYSKAVLNFTTELSSDIYYTLDSSEPSINSIKYYNKSVTLEENTTVKAISIIDGKTVSPVEEKYAIVHKAMGKKVNVQSTINEKYSAGGPQILTNLDFGGDKWGNGKWLGILDEDFIATIDFENNIKVSEFGFSCIRERGAGIYFPSKIEILGSLDGKIYESIGDWDNTLEISPNVESKIIEVKCNNKEYTSIKVIATSLSTVEKKKGVFIFIDELLVK